VGVLVDVLETGFVRVRVRVRLTVVGVLVLVLDVLVVVVGVSVRMLLAVVLVLVRMWGVVRVLVAHGAPSWIDVVWLMGCGASAVPARRCSM
jgi:hypothetical protein